MGRLAGRRAIITDGAAGIRAAATRVLAEAGAGAAILDVNAVAQVACSLASDEAGLINGAVIPVDSGASAF